MNRRIAIYYEEGALSSVTSSAIMAEITGSKFTFGNVLNSIAGYFANMALNHIDNQISDKANWTLLGKNRSGKPTKSEWTILLENAKKVNQEISDGEQGYYGGYKNPEYRVDYEARIMIEKYYNISLNDIKDFSIGLKLFTGLRDDISYNKEKKKFGSKIGPTIIGDHGEKYIHNLVEEKGPQYRLGALFIGYKGYQMGVNSERIRHCGQNWLAHYIISKNPGFRMINNNWNGFINYQTPNPFTLW